MSKQNRTPEENELYELLIFLIEKFEQEFYQPGSASNGISLLQFLMEQRNIKISEIEKILGDDTNWNQLINKTTVITSEEARKLANFLRVHYSLFLE